jgi:hypothetical protein
MMGCLGSSGFRLAGPSSVFTAELTAIFMSMNYIAFEILFNFDSMSSIRANGIQENLALLYPSVCIRV